MRPNLIRYYLKEGFKNFFKNRLMSVASVGTTFATLLILGLFVLASLNLNAFTQQIARDCEMQAFVSDSVNWDTYKKIGETIESLEGVETVTLYTKDQIFQEMREKFSEQGKAGMLDAFVEDNPYRNSYKITLTDLSYMQTVYDKVRAMDGVEKITEVQDLANQIYSISNSIRHVTLWVVVVFCIIAAFIISNSIKLSVFARRKDINIMKYIGATDWFIRWPFVIEGIIIGLFGAALSYAACWALYARLYGLPQIDLIELLPFADMQWYLAGAQACVGVLIGAIGSGISIRKHLKV